MSDFDLCAGIDYPGAQTPTARLKGLHVYAAQPGGVPQKRSSPARSNNGQPCNWTRAEIAQLLLEQARQGVRFLAGIDHGFSFPLVCFRRYGLASWSEFDEAGERIHFWPFDGWVPAPGKSVVAEVYPSIFRNRYAKEGRTVDEQDAYAVARWLSDVDACGALARYFAPQLTDLERATAEREGWIFGVM